MTPAENKMEGESTRVLVAIDGSEAAGIAVDLVADAAWPAGTEILVAEANWCASGSGALDESQA